MGKSIYFSEKELEVLYGQFSNYDELDFADEVEKERLKVIKSIEMKAWKSLQDKTKKHSE